LEVPASEPLSGAPVAARLFTLNDETNAIEAQLLGPAPSVDPQMQGRGYLLMVNPNPGLVPGAALTGYLSLPGEPRAGVLVPRNAVFRFDSATWIYHQTSDDTFVRESIVLDTPLSDGWFVEGELKPGDKVVSVGAQQLLSEELKGQGGGEQ
jgi:multidrug efflux pump subunit AcrA (membrane-fusion protein)